MRTNLASYPVALVAVRRVTPSEWWPESWQTSYRFDQQEVYGEVGDRGHANSYSARRSETLAAVRRVAPPGSSILDIAAAEGNFTLALAEQGYQVTWNDLRSELVPYVQLKYEYGDIRFTPGNAFELGLTGYDVVLATEVIEHVAHPDAFLACSAAMVRPGGHVVMSTPNGAFFRNRLPRFSDCRDPDVYESVQFQPDSDGHIFLLHGDEIASFSRAAGLELLGIEYFTNPLTAGFVGLGPALRLIPKSVVDVAERLTRRLPGPLTRRLSIAMLATFRRIG